MAFATIPAWSTTAGTNTEIDGISLAENVMVPSAVNNAFREMMSQVAEFTRRGSDLASASTLDLDSIDTMYLDITGTTTVTAVTLTDGHSRRARATGAFQLTASATLVVNGSTSSNYTTTAGDLLFFEGYGSSTVRVWTVSGGGSTTASTTEVLTGTNAAKAVTPDALAALWEKGSDEASAGTVAFGEGGFFHITGTTTITDIDFDTAKDGRAVDVVFDSALTLTHNGTTLQLPGARNITTATGDRARFVQDSSDNVICLWYIPAIADPPYITSWVAYTPTFTNFGTVSNVAFFSRRNGPDLEIIGKWTTGTVGGGEARVSMGFNGTDGNVTSNGTVIPSIQFAGHLGAGFNFAAAFYVMIESASTYMVFSRQDGSNNAMTKAVGSAVSTNSTTQALRASIPISGW